MSDDRTKWWRSTHSDMMRLLYVNDPDGIGASTSSPDDEYFDAAARLMRALWGCSTYGRIRDAVTGMWPDANPAMIFEVVRLWQSASEQAPFAFR